MAYDQNFYGGAGVVNGEGGNSERCLKWGGGNNNDWLQNLVLSVR